MKDYSTLSKIPELECHQQMQFSIIPYSHDNINNNNNNNTAGFCCFFFIHMGLFLSAFCPRRHEERDKIHNTYANHTMLPPYTHTHMQCNW